MTTLETLSQITESDVKREIAETETRLTHLKTVLATVMTINGSKAVDFALATPAAEFVRKAAKKPVKNTAANRLVDFFKSNGNTHVSSIPKEVATPNYASQLLSTDKRFKSDGHDIWGLTNSRNGQAVHG